MSCKQILVLNGANMDTLGKRDTGAFGSNTLNSIMEDLTTYAASIDVVLEHKQSNYEGELIEWIHKADETADGIIINPGSFGHYSIGIREAIDAVSIPCVEVHLANFFRKPENRSVIASSCKAIVCGFGKDSYKIALDGLQEFLA